MSADWDVLFGDTEDEEEVSSEIDEEMDDEDYTDIDEDDEEEAKTKKKEKSKKEKKPKGKKGGLFGNLKKDKTKEISANEEETDADDDDGNQNDEPVRESVHGLKKKQKKEFDPYANSKASPVKIIIAGAGVVAVIAVIAIVGLASNKKTQSLTEANQNLTQQIASRTVNVYTAKRDIAKGDEIILFGDNANAELSQVYTSLSQDSYVQDGETGYAQVDISAGMPIMANEIGDTNPVTALADAIAEAENEYTKAKTMPYRITADFVDLSTGNTLVESRDLLLDAGANEKAFNTEAEDVDGYALKTIQVDGESVHAYGISEKSMKGGIVSMYYYTTKGGWGRHEMKGNIRVTFGYVKKDDPSAKETDVFDDSAWIEEPIEAEGTVTTETDTSEDDSSEAVTESLEKAEVTETETAENTESTDDIVETTESTTENN